MLTNFIVVIILQYIHMPNHHVIYLKLTQLYISLISQVIWGNITLGKILTKTYQGYNW